MKPVFTAISAVLLVGSLSTGMAQALPRIGSASIGETDAAPAHVETARLVCNFRRCFRTGYRYYRPYGYYRPYYYRPGIGVGIGPFGVGIY